ncbi:DNA cytosine methyltransferase [Variovorax atrisoli]|uniref:DNA cytosine methyltransferase n=1 Tax=Variovorax atrisoli TaxID=3394203 RepID=UPI0033991F0C
MAANKKVSSISDESASDSRPISVDLFCGSGGLSEGLRLAGFRSVVAVDFDKNAAATFKKNHPDTVVLNADISQLDADEIKKHLGGRELDLLAGGPSCQGYSTHGKRDPNDPRNFLFLHYLRIARALRPKWLLIENVQGLLTYNKGFFREVILDELEQMGYHADAKVLCAADFGVPQLRKRVIFLATRQDCQITFPQPTHTATGQRGLKPYVTVGEAFFDLPPIQGNRRDALDYTAAPRTHFQRYLRGGTKKLTLHEARDLSEQAAAIAAHVQEGQGLRNVPLSVLPDRFKKMRTISTGELRRDCTTLYHRLSRAKPSYTITCYFRNVASGPFLHPLEDRSLSIREAARLMTFPDTYEFCGTSIPRQIGNAVPPLLGRAVGEHILKLMRSEQDQKQVHRQQADRPKSVKRKATEECLLTSA